ncbi:MAG: flippase [Butyrivibrio sp.]|uniref:flippase n=1 Tax=Butyrivibrio sp. TaxID=28121 RepID=UPI0026015A84|nr:flippase [Butyrivibrio sp.]MCR5770848.1 flippase [Butyrivibrio sp.]
MHYNKKIGINAILNVIKSGLSILFPIVTYPYALRVLGAENIGKVSYSQSIISYFSLIAMMGISTYGTREGSKIRNDKIELDKFVSELFSINIFTSAFSFFLLFISLLLVDKFSNYRILLIINSLSIIFTTFGIDWLNQVFEDYFFITIRSIVAHIVSMLILFMFVRTSNDYIVYAFLAVTTNMIICVSNWFYCRKYVKIKFTITPKWKKHLKPLLTLFANAIAVSIYVNVDVTMLGWIKDDYDVGLYTVSVKIYSIIKTMLVAVYAVSIPRLASYAGENKLIEYRRLYTRMWKALSIIVIPAGVGLILVSKEVMMLMGGSEYLEATPALQILALSLIFAIFGGLLTACLNVTLGRESINLQATIVSAALNVVLNLFFIQKLSFVGASITTAISELFVVLFCYLKAKDISMYLEKNIVKRVFINVGIASSTMGLTGYIFTIIMKPGIFRMICVIPSCICVYILILVCLKEESVLEFWGYFKKKLKYQWLSM